MQCNILYTSAAQNIGNRNKKDSKRDNLKLVLFSVYYTFNTFLQAQNIINISVPILR